MLFVGDDWAEDHHDIEVVDQGGRVLARRRLPEGVAGIAALRALLAAFLDPPGVDGVAEGVADAAATGSEQVVVGIETDRGPWVQALLAAGYTVYAINPLQAARYRQRHGSAGTKSDRGDAHILAELVRLDRSHHRPVAGDTATVRRIKILARAHQSMIWARQRQANALRSLLREFYPAALAAFGTDLAGRDALAVLALAPTPTAGRALRVARVESALRRAGRQRYLATTTETIVAALRGEHLEATPGVEAAYGATVAAMVAVLTALSGQVNALELEVEQAFAQHPDAEIVRSQPGLGAVLGARVLAEFGDDPGRYRDAKARKNYSGMAPVTRASGRSHVVLARHARNRRLADALYQQGFAALCASPGARAYYDSRRARGQTHHAALRAVSNRLVGILHGCLRQRELYSEPIAWPATIAEQSPEPGTRRHTPSAGRIAPMALGT